MVDYRRHVVTVCEPPALMAWMQCQNGHHSELTWHLYDLSGADLRLSYREDDPTKFAYGFGDGIVMGDV
jgi:hypothetical protein